MKSLDPFAFRRGEGREGVLAFGELLAERRDLSERKEILAFFRDHPHLAAAVGSANPHVLRHDRLAFEFPLFGEYVCDLVVGDSRTRQYCFVEFEDATPRSVFSKKKGKTNPDWSDRLNRGFSQIIDWFMILEDQRRSALHKARFGADVINFNGLLVIGRDAHLDEVQRERLSWRSQNVLVGGKHVYCQTFDELHRTLSVKLEFLDES